MGISVNCRTVADVRFETISGMHVIGGYGLRLSLSFNVLNWDNPDPPAVIFGATRVYLLDAGEVLLGLALPETPQPFRITNFGHTDRAFFDIQLTPQAMETVERLRNGQGIRLKIKLRPEIRTRPELTIGYEEVVCAVNVSDWLAALDETQYGRSILFEVPLPADLPDMKIIADQLESARRHLALGHYSDVVAACRVALESLKNSLGQNDAMNAARALQKSNKQQLDLVQRELFLRQALTDYCSLAHHPTDVPLGELFDRNAALMALGSTAALVSSALGRHAARKRTT